MSAGRSTCKSPVSVSGRLMVCGGSHVANILVQNPAALLVLTIIIQPPTSVRCAARCLRHRTAASNGLIYAGCLLRACMSYGGAVCKVGRHLLSHFLRSIPRQSLGLIQATTSYRPYACHGTARRWVSQLSQPQAQHPRTEVTPIDRKLDAFMTQICEGLPPDVTNTVLRSSAMVLKSETTHGPQLRSAILTMLKTFADDGDILLVDRLLRAASEVFELPIDDNMHSTILQALRDSGHLLQASAWLQDMPSKPGACQPSLQEWNDFLEDCIAREQFTVFRANMYYIQSSDLVTPDTRTYHLIFQAIFHFDRKHPPPIALVRRLLERMKRDGVSFSRSILDILVAGYNNFHADGMVQLVERMHSSTEGKVIDFSEASCIARLVEKLSEEGEKAAKAHLNRWTRQGFKPTQATLEAVAGHLSSAKALLDWERRLNVVATPLAWMSVIRNAATEHPAEVALDAYGTFLKRGFIPTAAVIHPIVRAILSTNLRPPTVDDIRRALEVHREYVRLVDTRAKESHSHQEDLPIYNTLIRAIVSSSHVESYPLSLSLLEEIQSRGIIMDYMTTTSFLTLLMRLAPDGPRAFKIYRAFYKYPEGGYALDGPGFQSVLDVFCKYGLSRPSFFSLYLAILKDMRLAGYPATVENYTILLRQLGSLAADLGDNPKELAELAFAIRRVHNTLTVEASISPDTILWNQLMDAYQRAGCYQEAYNVWESLYISGKYDNASVSIVIDTCSFAGAFNLVAEIFARLHAAGYSLNQKNWANWIEGLARIGRIEEATKVLCLAMPQEGVEPTKEMARSILTFAARRNQESEVRQRIKRYLPRLFDQLSQR